MLFKATMKLRLATAVSNPNAPVKRIAGWSEGHYFQGNTVADLLNAFIFGPPPGGPSLCSRRAALLPIGSAVIGQRIQILDPPGPSQSLARVFAGSANIACDVPQMQLLCRVPTVGTTNVLQMKIKGIPDVRVVEGEYVPSDTYKQALDAYFAQLTQWRFRGRDFANVGQKIFSITPTDVPYAGCGRITLEFPNAGVFAVGDKVTVKNTLTTFGLKVNGRFNVVLVGPAAGDYTVALWNAGLCRGGKVVMPTYFYPQIDGSKITISRITVGKVGRPSDQYVGRRSKKKAG